MLAGGNMRWLDSIQTAFVNLGGVAGYQDLYVEIGKIRGQELSRTDKATVRKEIERCSSDSKNWKRRVDLFYTVKGLGKGIWGLCVAERKTPQANDLSVDVDVPSGQEQPERQRSEVFRILRDTRVARALKQLHMDTCQICGIVIELGDGSTYSEAHHIKPIGNPHRGPDTPENIIVVCPNCHVRLDYFAVPLDLTIIARHRYHSISPEFVSYHNARQSELEET